MTDDELHVKEVRDAEGHRVFIVVWIRRCKERIAKLPYTGWYIAFLLALNTILNLLDLFRH